MRRKGFTLIELLVVIAIIAVLSVVVILTLNPAELLRQSRDSNRLADMSTIKSAIGTFLTDQNASSSALGVDFMCYIDGDTTSTCAQWFPSSTATTTVSSTAVDGTGWVPINLTLIAQGSPIATWPIDPLNNDQIHFYTYIMTSTLQFKVAARMESNKFAPGGPSDVSTNDDGVDSTTYEQGTNLTL